MENFTHLHVLTLLLFITFLQPTNVSSSSFGNETDHLSLLKFKESIATDPYGFLNSWNASVHFCKWRGITCGRRHQRVTTLNLPHAELHGTISPYIGNLSFLKTLNLFNNSFSGNIPQQVDHLFRLRHLNLSVNILEGGIPTNLTFCPELSIISLGTNCLTREIPSEIGSLKKLVHLNLQKNNLTGGIPPSLGNLSSMAVLSLASNNLAGDVPEETGQLRKLSFFSVTSNNLTGTIPRSLFNFSSMNIFSLSANKFKGSIPHDIGLNMPNLLKVYLGGNEFSGQIPASFSNASQLQILDLGKNHFVGQVPLIFENLPNLQQLNFEINNLGNNSSNDLGFITSLTNCSNLEILSLSVNNFGGVLPNSIVNFSTQLSFLSLGFNQIAGTIPRTIENLKNLMVLSLDNNLFTGIIPASLGKLQKLQLLFLNTNRLSGCIPSSIGNLTQLSEVYLTVNNLEGRIPPDIGNCQKLQTMEISQNRLTGNIPPQVIGIPFLSALDLSKNSLNGSLSLEVGELKNINTLDISENGFTGEIPESIGNCLNLEGLFLRGNRFQGIIPPSLAFLRGLQYLDLSGNNLSGNIPKDLEKLPFLIYLNLSSNNLEGKVPKEGVFRNKSALSLDGNNKLCGGVMELQLPACPIKVTKQRTIFHGFKLKLTISLVVGCSFLSAVFLIVYWRRKPQNKKPLFALSPIKFLSMVSYHTLYQATDGFSPSNQVGSGGFGSVYKGILDQEENTIVAIKVLKLQQKGASKSFVAECNALRSIRHRNLVKIITCCSSTDNNGNDFKALVFEYMSNGTLEEWLYRENQSRSLNLLQRLNIASDVASALCYLHDHCEPQIIHRDMKPSNVLLDDDMVAHVSDFGLARLIPPKDSSQNQSSTVGIKGTVGYAAPEYAVGAEPSEQGDVYSFGILVLQLFTGRRPTDDMFVDGCNIHTFVKTAIQGRLGQIVDPTLMATLDETTTSTTIDEVTNNEIEYDEENIESGNLSKRNTYVWKCILPALKIGVACSEESPKNRMCMEEVQRELQRIKNAYDCVDIRRERPKRS